MTFNEIKKLVDELADMGCLYLNLTGGDPLIRDDFCEIYKYILAKGIIPSVETGLTRLTDDQIALFKEYNPEKLLVSLYSMDECILKRVTGSNIKSDCILDNILKLKNEGIQFQLRTPFTKLNINQAGKIAIFARKNKFDYTCTTKIFWKQTGERCDYIRCTPKDIEPYLKQDPVYDKLYREAVYLEQNVPCKRDCCTGIYDFNITAYATLNYCITFWKPEYNLRNGSFSDAWNNWYPLFRRQEGNYCLGKQLYSDDNEVCPYGKIYKDQQFDCKSGLDLHARNRIKNLENGGYSKDKIKRTLKIDEKTYLMLKN